MNSYSRGDTTNTVFSSIKSVSCEKNASRGWGAYLEFLPHLQIVVIREVPRQPMNLDPRILVLVDEFERDRHQPVLLQRRDLARVRSWNFGLRVRLSDDVEVRDRTEVVLDVSVNVDTVDRGNECQKPLDLGEES